MENFKKELRAQMIATVWAAAANEILHFIMNILFKENVSAFASDISTYLSIFLFVFAFVQWFRYMLMIQDEKKLEALYVNSKDERNVFLKEKTSGVSFMLSIYMLCAGVIVSSFFSQEICAALMCVIISMLLVRLGCKIYYEHKF